MVVLMIVVGGITRLTGSGLSMVDWRPIMGVLPPISEVEWNTVFLAYQQFPEYQQINKNITLEEFKGIFYWEYGHRVLGRLIGLVFFLPFLAFVVMGKVRGSLAIKLSIGLVLGGLQGLMVYGHEWPSRYSSGESLQASGTFASRHADTLLPMLVNF
jgi:cytochrome c oxidase assembly protein subunit 15